MKLICSDMRALLYLVFITIIISSCSGDSHYERFLDEISDLEKNSDYGLAREQLKLKMHLYPDNEFDLLKELVYLNEKLGYYKENLELFREAHARGYFFLIHPAMPKYKPYMELEDFASISERDLELRDSTNSVSIPVYDVILPLAHKKNKSYPLLFIFHGGGSNIERAKDYWTSEEIDNKYIRVFLQSAIHSDFNTYGWKNSDSSAVAIINEAYEYVRTSFSVNTSNIYICGISAGASSAIYSACTGNIAAKGLFVVCTGIPEDLTVEDYARVSDISFIIIGGETDYYRPRQNRLLDSLKKAELDYEYILIPGMGHQYPDNFSKLLELYL